MMTQRIVPLLLIALLILAACQAQEPTPTSMPTAEAAEPTATAAPPTATIAPTETPQPTATTAPTATAAPTEAPESSAWEEAECQFDIPAGQEVKCGYLTVLEDRSRPDGPALRLHAAIFRSPSDEPEPDPIVYLAGGPGENALDAASLLFNQRFVPFIEDRDLIIIDQRGTGLSEPALDCPEVTELGLDLLDDDIPPEEALELGLAAVEACRVRLEEDADLAAYTSAANAADLEELRLALGYDEWNVYGISYGTRLAQTLMRDYPGAIRSVVLDSVYPLQLDLYATTPTNAWRAIQVLFDGCAADEACSAAFPNLEEVLATTAAELNASPVTVELTNPLSGESYEALFNGDALYAFLFQSLYSAEIIPLLPEIIYDASEGDFTTMAQIYGAFLANADFMSLGMQLAVQCAEEVPFSDAETVAEAAAAVPELESLFAGSPNLGPGLFTVCEAWNPAADPDPAENEAISSDIPTLILAGEYDPITPPDWGRLVAENLDDSFYFEFPGIGHGASVSGECPAQVMLAFITDPATEPEAGCIAEMAGPDFVREEVEIVLVPLESETFGFTGVVPEGWQEVAPGVYARGSSALDRAVLIEQSASRSPEEMLELLASQLGLDEMPAEAGARQTADLNWTLYEVAVQGVAVDVAVAEADDTTYLILLQSDPAERDSLYEAVFLPVVDALTPQ